MSGDDIYDLDSVESFADISSDPDVQQALEDAYGDVDDRDLWPAALAEDRVTGAAVGETLQAVTGHVGSAAGLLLAAGASSPQQCDNQVHARPLRR